MATEDDQTAALLAGFESDRDSEDPEEDLNWGDDAQAPALTKTQRKVLEKAEKASKSNEPGVVYVGRVPRGFMESQMKKYFSQFGTITRLRLSRNKKTGASKHYAFVEFASTEVADIVARTMDNYLMFGHILKCRLIPPEQVHSSLFQGAGQRFKVDPRNKKARLAMERGAPRAQWEKRVDKENERRAERAKQLKEEFDYEYHPSALKSVDEVPIRTSLLENGEPQKLLTELPAEEAAASNEDKDASHETQPTESTPAVPKKKGKKASKSKAVDNTNEEKEATPEAAELVAVKKAQKDKKRKSNVAVDDPAMSEDVIADEPSSEPRKSKKANTTDIVTGETKKTKRKVDPEERSVSKPKKAKKAKA